MIMSLEYARGDIMEIKPKGDVNMSSIIEKAKEVRQTLSNMEKMDEMNENINKFASSYPKAHIILKCVNPNEDIDLTEKYEVSMEDIEVIAKAKKEKNVAKLMDLIKDDEQK